MAETPISPRRRWFSFSVRTLLVMVTLSAAPMWWVGLQWRIVQERQRLRHEIEHAGGNIVPLTSWTYAVAATSGGSRFLPSEAQQQARYEKRAHLPFPRKWLGDEPIELIDLPYPYSEPHVGPIRVAFPEATLHPFRAEDH
jgi:hypothetical protein